MNYLNKSKKLLFLIIFTYFLNTLSLTEGKSTHDGPQSVTMPILSKGKSSEKLPQGRTVEEASNPEEEASNPEEEASNPEEEVAKPEEEASNPEEEASNPEEEVAKPEEEASPTADAAPSAEENDQSSADTGSETQLKDSKPHHTVGLAFNENEDDAGYEKTIDSEKSQDKVQRIKENKEYVNELKATALASGVKMDDSLSEEVDYEAPNHAIGLSFNEDDRYEKVLDQEKKAEIKQRTKENKEYRNEMREAAAAAGIRDDSAQIDSIEMDEDYEKPSHTMGLSFVDKDEKYEKVLEKAKKAEVSQRMRENKVYKEDLARGGQTMAKSGTKKLYEPKLYELPKHEALNYLEGLTKAFQKKNMKEIQRHRNHQLLLSVLKSQGAAH